MSYEYPTAIGLCRLLRIGQHWAVELNGSRRGRWHTPEAAALALAHHKSGLSEWDGKQSEIPENLLDWRPLDESL